MKRTLLLILVTVTLLFSACSLAVPEQESTPKQAPSNEPELQLLS